MSSKSSLTPTPVKCDEKHEQQHKSAWFQFIKSVATFKGDLTSLTAPPFLLAPQSIVEYSTYWSEHPSLLVAPAKEENAERRALLVSQWFLSTLSRQHNPKDENGKKKKLKPLNPFLGELFLGKWEDEAGTTQLISEQVSHHPPETAYKVWNEQHGVKVEGHIAPKSYFNGSINIERKGYGIMHIDKHNEDYLFTMPKVHVEGVMTFNIAPELGGTSYIRSSSGYTTRVDYSSKGWLRGKSNSFVATIYRDNDEKNPIYTLEGQWSGSYTIKNAKGKTVDTVNMTALTRTPLYVAPIEKQHPLESRRAWQHVINGINNNDISAIGQEKSKVENAQRSMRKQEQVDGVVWQRRYFTEVAEDSLVKKLVIPGKGEAGGDGTHMVWRFDEKKYKAALSEERDGRDSGIGFLDGEN